MVYKLSAQMLFSRFFLQFICLEPTKTNPKTQSIFTAEWFILADVYLADDIYKHTFAM